MFTTSAPSTAASMDVALGVTSTSAGEYSDVYTMPGTVSGTLRRVRTHGESASCWITPGDANADAARGCRVMNGVKRGARPRTSVPWKFAPMATTRRTFGAPPLAMNSLVMSPPCECATMSNFAAPVCSRTWSTFVCTSSMMLSRLPMP